MRAMRSLFTIAVLLCALTIGVALGETAGAYGVSAGQGMTATINSGNYRAWLYGVRENAVRDDGAFTADPSRYTQDYVCASITQKMVYVTPYGTYTFWDVVDIGCGRLGFTFDQQQTTGRIKGKIESLLYGSGTLSLDVTFTEAGAYVPFVGGDRRTTYGVSPNPDDPPSSGAVTIGETASAGVQKPASASGTISSSVRGGITTKKTGAGLFFQSAGGGLDITYV